MLAVPLSQSQVDAANRLRELYLHGWQRADAVLHTLAERFPSNLDPLHVIPKAVTLNAVYATNVLAIVAMADHVCEVLRTEPDPPGPEVVERIAQLKGLGPKGEASRRFLSFAWKYCHFFVCPQRFPIRDELADRALTYHLGRTNRRPLRGWPDDYPNYVADINGLREAGQLDCDYAHLDRYLWLCGQWLEYQERKGSEDRGPISEEVWKLFRCPPDETARGLLQAASGGSWSGGA